MARELKRAFYKAVGHSSHEVTGSCHLIRYKDQTILLDYGMYQTNDTINDYRVNKTRHKDIKPKEVNYIFISHVHADHCALLPTLYKDGCQAQIILPKNSKMLLRLMLMDSVTIMERDEERYGKRDNVSIHPLYSKEDVDTVLEYVNEYEFDQEYVLREDLRFKLFSANHIVNAAQIYLEINDGNVIRKVGYTGDIGSPKNEKTYIEPMQALPQVDLLIGECTYANNTRVHKRQDRRKDIEKIKTVVDRCKQDKGKILIPVFSLNRLEDVLSELYSIYSSEQLKMPIVVDTPLGQNIANIWETSVKKDAEFWKSVWSWDNVQKPASYKESQAWQHIDGSMIVISSGGMLTAGRAVGWAQILLPDPKNHIMFCGFSSKNSVASQIKNYKENHYVKIDGKSVKNNAQVSILNSFSSHADHDELLEYYTDINYNKIVLVHSDDSKLQFGEELKESLSRANRTSRVIIANQDTKVMI